MNDRTVPRFIYLLLITLLAIPITWSRPALLPAESAAPAQNSKMMVLPNFPELITTLTPVTVNISSTKTVRPELRNFGPPGGGEQDPFRDFFGDDYYRRFFGDNPNREYKQQGLGSGFIIDPEGYILTNNHVVEGADQIKVKIHSEKEYEAEIVGRDPKTDLALIKIKGLKENNLPAASLGDSDALKVGEWVIAIGNPFGLQETVTAGIVSAKWRKIGAGPYEDFIQTDASINPGNSGGPLFNLNGEVVGVNTMIYSPSGGNVGIGFAIPINLARNIVQQLKDKGRVVRGWLGVIVQTVTPELADSFGLTDKAGALIAEVEPDGPADQAGIQSGDIILSFDGQKIKEMSELPLIVAETPVGKKTKVSILRNGKKKVLTVKIGELEDKEASPAAEKTPADLGLSVREITPEMASRYGLGEENGLIVMAVEPGSPAEDAGLRRGDIVKEINRKPIASMEDYQGALRESKSENMLFLVKERPDGTLGGH